MYRKIFVFAILGFAMMMTACKKDKDTAPDPYDTQYSDLSVADNKTNLENAGIDLINEMDQFKSGNAIKITYNLANMMDGSFGLKSTASSAFFMPVEFSKSISQDKATPERLLDAMTALMTNEGPANLKDAWDSIVGKYTWNFGTQQFDKTEMSDAIVIEFPALETDQTNTATYTVNGFQYTTITEPMYEVNPAADFQLPTALHVDLQYNGDKLTSLDFTASYQSNGLPTNASITWNIDNFSLNLSASHTPYTNASLSFTLKHSDKVLIDTKWEAAGDWSQQNIDNSTHTVYDTIWVQEYDAQSGTWVNTDQIAYIDQWETTDVQNIIRNANAQLTILNIKVAGQVNIKAVVNAENNLSDKVDNELLTQEEAAKQLADTINANAKLVVIYADNNTKIAAAEAYAYHDLQWDDWYPEIRFVFGDGSKADAATYFGEGFDNFFNALNDFIAEINQEYDVNIDPVNVN